MDDISLSGLGKSLNLLYAEVLNLTFFSLGQKSPIRHASLQRIWEGFENEKQRFQVWSSNVGLFDLGHQSLDYQLQRAPRFRAIVQRLLADLVESVRDALTQTPSIYSPQGKKNLGLVLEEIVDSMDKLFQLTTEIGTPSICSGLGDVTYLSQLTSNDTDQSVSFLVAKELVSIKEHIKLCRTEFPAAAEQHILEPPEHAEREVWLEKQARFNALRHLQFRKWQKDRGKNEQARTSNLVELNKQATRSGLGSDFQLPTQSELEQGTAPPTGLKGQLPPWPSHEELVHTDYRYFECPFCFSICPSEYKATWNCWREHLVHDTRPYACTYYDCEDLEATFNSRKDWLSHESYVHRAVWKCSEHPREIFSEESYTRHVKNYHGEYETELTSSAGLQSAIQPTRQDDRPCPFCLIMLPTQQVREMHLMFHFEAIASLALPFGKERGKMKSHARDSETMAKSGIKGLETQDPRDPESKSEQNVEERHISPEKEIHSSKHKHEAQDKPTSRSDRPDEFFLRGDFFDQKALQVVLNRYHGPEALVQPMVNEGVHGYLITAVSPFTSEMLEDFWFQCRLYAVEMRNPSRRVGVSYDDYQTTQELEPHTLIFKDQRLNRRFESSLATSSRPYTDIEYQALDGVGEDRSAATFSQSRTSSGYGDHRSPLFWQPSRWIFNKTANQWLPVASDRNQPLGVAPAKRTIATDPIENLKDSKGAEEPE